MDDIEEKIGKKSKTAQNKDKKLTGTKRKEAQNEEKEKGQKHKKVRYENDNAECIYCSELYSVSGGRWIQCVVCHRWALTLSAQEFRTKLKRLFAMHVHVDLTEIGLSLKIGILGTLSFLSD
jgi:hypothetical protein